MTIDNTVRPGSRRDTRAADVIRRAREQSRETEQFLRDADRERKENEPILRRAGLIR